MIASPSAPPGVDQAPEDHSEARCLRLRRIAWDVRATPSPKRTPGTSKYRRFLPVAIGADLRVDAAAGPKTAASSPDEGGQKE